jgi:hypothetical protein
MPKTTLPALHEKKRRPRKKPAYDAHVDRVQALADQLYAEVARETFASLTFEEKQDAIASGLRKAGARMEERALRESLTNAELIEVDGVAYRRLKQCSGATYFGMWGVHRIDESLYREVGVHNGRTIKPLERAAGIVTKTMTPMLARTLGEMQARMTSREATAQLQRLGLGSGERAYAADHVHMLEQEIADDIVELERAARAQEKIPKGVASISLGMDRRSVPMEEARPADQPPKTERRPRRKPYVRKRPAPIDVNYRMAYVGTVSLIDENGDAIHTTRYTMEADGDARELAERLRAEVEHILATRPGLPISIVQDGAKEFDVLPETLRRGKAANTQIYECTDFHHLVGYLDAVVAACEPAGDPKNMRPWYREKLLCDDRGIDQIFAGLRRRAAAVPKTAANVEARRVLARALSYIRTRRRKMRYAIMRRADLVIGSGTTESTCKLIGHRTNRSGTRWSVPGVRGTMAICALVLSDRWEAAWRHYATSKISAVTRLSDAA